MNKLCVPAANVSKRVGKLNNILSNIVFSPHAPSVALTQTVPGTHLFPTGNGILSLYFILDSL